MTQRSMIILVTDHEAFAKAGQVVVVIGQDDPHKDQPEVVVASYPIDERAKADALADQLSKAFPWAGVYGL